VTFDDDTLRRLLAALQHGPVSLRGGDCSGDSRAVNAFVELIRHTPALAAEVLRLRHAARAFVTAADALRVAACEDDDPAMAGLRADYDAAFDALRGAR